MLLDWHGRRICASFTYRSTSKHLLFKAIAMKYTLIRDLNLNLLLIIFYFCMADLLCESIGLIHSFFITLVTDAPPRPRGVDLLIPAAKITRQR